MVDGITFGRHIFIRPKYLQKRQNKLIAPKDLMAHELAHTIQYSRTGAIPFFMSYIGEFFRALRRKRKWDFQSRVEAYLEIPHEIEARDCAAAFLRHDRRN